MNELTTILYRLQKVGFIDQRSDKVTQKEYLVSNHSVIVSVYFAIIKFTFELIRAALKCAVTRLLSSTKR